jgi:hypothetical protein
VKATGKSGDDFVKLLSGATGQSSDDIIRAVMDATGSSYDDVIKTFASTTSKNADEVARTVSPEINSTLDNAASGAYTGGAGEAANVNLHYKQGWTPEQKVAADKKLKALTEATTIYTPVNRSGTSARAIYKKAYGNNSIPQGFDIDHIVDLQLGGTQDLSNLWALDYSVNRSLGKQINNFIKNNPYGTAFGKFTIT